MKHIAFIIIAWLSVTQLKAQDNTIRILQTIEQNNTTLKALRLRAEADKTGNHTGINMANPEVEFGYLWGDKDADGNRHDLSVSQSFDFPTAYRYKRQLAGQLDRQVDLVYEQQKREIMFEARNLLVELAYRQMNKEILNNRVDQARLLFDSYQLLLDKGETDIIEYNKTRLNLVNIEKTFQLNEVEINTLTKELERLNGGDPFNEVKPVYSSYQIPIDFDEWFALAKEVNPSINLAAQQIEASRKQLQLTRSLNLPKFSAGYTNTFEGGSNYNGFTVGVSIPLWESKNTVKAQKARTIALQSEHQDNTLQFYNTLSGQYEKAKKLDAVLNEYKKTLEFSNDYDLLRKAFEKGKMSLITYLQELAIYYDTVDLYMETERDYQLAIAQLERWAN